jgi:hypothetical protein
MWSRVHRLLVSLPLCLNEHEAGNGCIQQGNLLPSDFGMRHRTASDSAPHAICLQSLQCSLLRQLDSRRDQLSGGV